jgi:hypothetical protein
MRWTGCYHRRPRRGSRGSASLPGIGIAKSNRQTHGASSPKRPFSDRATALIRTTLSSQPLISAAVSCLGKAGQRIEPLPGEMLRVYWRGGSSWGVTVKSIISTPRITVKVDLMPISSPTSARCRSSMLEIGEPLKAIMMSPSVKLLC